MSLQTVPMSTPFQLNPLNVNQLRVLDHCPPHFYVVDFDLACNPKKITDWIYKHLTGRYYFGEVIATGSISGYSIQKRVAFEIHGEASYFALMLGDINKF